MDCLALDARQRSDDRWLFKYIVVELFPRKLTPEYDTKDSAHNKYLTWKTAHEDIDQQRTAGGKGPIYYVRCRLVDKNANNFESVEKWWDRECDCWIADPALVRPEFCEKRMYKYPIKPEWVYVITEAREITREQAQKYIVAQTKDNYGYGSW